MALGVAVVSGVLLAGGLAELVRRVRALERSLQPARRGDRRARR